MCVHLVYISALFFLCLIVVQVSLHFVANFIISLISSLVVLTQVFQKFFIPLVVKNCVTRCSSEKFRYYYYVLE